MVASENSREDHYCDPLWKMNNLPAYSETEGDICDERNNDFGRCDPLWKINNIPAYSDVENLREGNGNFQGHCDDLWKMNNFPAYYLEEENQEHSYHGWSGKILSALEISLRWMMKPMKKLTRRKNKNKKDTSYVRN